MHKDNIEKTMFVTADGQYEWLVLPMGLTNVPSSFQCIMNNALSDLTRTCVKVYLDDIIIHSKSVAEHMKCKGPACQQALQHLITLHWATRHP